MDPALSRRIARAVQDLPMDARVRVADACLAHPHAQGLDDLPQLVRDVVLGHERQVTTRPGRGNPTPGDT